MSQRKSAAQTCDKSPPDAGVDLNRNYDVYFAIKSKGSSDDPCGDDYNGPTAVSEPETQAARDLPNNSVFGALARELAHFNGFGYVQSWKESNLYTVNGETSGWMWQAHGIFAMSPEVVPAFEVSSVPRSQREDVSHLPLARMAGLVYYLAPEESAARSDRGRRLDDFVLACGVAVSNSGLRPASAELLGSVYVNGTGASDVVHLELKAEPEGLLRTVLAAISSVPDAVVLKSVRTRDTGLSTISEPADSTTIGSATPAASVPAPTIESSPTATAANTNVRSSGSISTGADYEFIINSALVCVVVGSSCDGFAVTGGGCALLPPSLPANQVETCQDQGTQETSNSPTTMTTKSLIYSTQNVEREACHLKMKTWWCPRIATSPCRTSKALRSSDEEVVQNLEARRGGRFARTTTTVASYSKISSNLSLCFSHAWLDRMVPQYTQWWRSTAGSNANNDDYRAVLQQLADATGSQQGGNGHPLAEPEIYLDMGCWTLSDDDQAAAVAKIVNAVDPSYKCKGISLNTSNYRSNAEMAATCERFVKASGREYKCIVGTSGNFVSPSTTERDLARASAVSGVRRRQPPRMRCLPERLGHVFLTTLVKKWPIIFSRDCGLLAANCWLLTAGCPHPTDGRTDGRHPIALAVLWK
ncbi:hypothetical protein PHYSODRAFT_307876 [Phytophthora sojae]|uniref:Peptidase M14 domain-containing protein n=1 Tax=Phytophthora sojae (strain P6497) TaxID=1094619 RepID=G5AGN0_PHYSP|nr:hypothetical protein PHYSODRAFT_307876 [Phytophthora sojae]EGZ05310.1 hypothetical protein PHYSODRAFT_307876 [Phytophthora sojae]|eukprot:XP_009539231.1 hypothetical protein PHYSODRAFT_307876 [Phytophthora sojae]